MDAHARDLDAVRAAAVPDGNRAVVVGSSLGGGIIVARTHECGGERLAGVVLAGSGGSGLIFSGFPSQGLPDWAENRLRPAWTYLLRAIALLGGRIRRVETVSNRLVRRYAFTSSAPRELVDLDALPEAELVSLTEEGHMLPLTDGELVADHVARWVGRVGLRSAP